MPSLPVYLVILAVIVCGATLQGSVGFGLNLVVVPVMALLAPDALPGTLLLSGLPLSILMARREHHRLDRSGLTWLTVGRVPGTVLGAVVVAAVSADVLGGLAGAIVLVAVLLSVISPPVPVNAPTATTAGFAAGALGTTAAIEGPPQALLYQHHPSETLRATLATSFVIGAAMSISALLIAGEIRWWQLGLAVGLMPGVVVGLVLSRTVARRVHGRSLRPVVLLIAGLTGVAAVVRALV